MALSDNADPKAASTAPHARPVAKAPKRATSRTAWIIAVVATVAVISLLTWQITTLTGPQRGSFTAAEAAPPAAPASVLTSYDTEAPLPDLDAVLPDLLADPRFGDNMSAVIADAATGDVVYEQNAATPLTPASSMKLVTAVAAFQTLGAGYRIETSVVEGPDEDTVVLVAGGDVAMTVDGEGYYGEGASLTELADAVLEARGGDAPSTVILDASLFSDSVNAADVPMADLAIYTAPAAPIMIDGGRIDNTQHYTQHHADPAIEAAKTFAGLLGADKTVTGTAPEGASELATVHSEPLANLVDSLILTSDNELADAVAFQTALAVEGEMTWAAIGTAHLAMLEELGVDTTGLVLNDGSGMSPSNRLTAGAFTEMLVAAAQAQASTVFESLPVAGYSGSLADRFATAEDGMGAVRGKTGTLPSNRVASLTGSLTTEDGRLLMYSLISNGWSNLDDVENAMDEVTAVIAQCGC
ncbi:D-alanyl-D-alanine carboxypeptidase/D-alanyl-D-alanine endopeptidase [Glycomyces buryatensis]|uniref:D-alanyl-D-alanine carboxypeptidase/D-alanyl-D-alanine-endopeptidase n=1 Tax=Glycomyces buryatensis TaxID=2570927 RepID=A0A4S8QDZ6_9ACTN|nr:D-alanyl-D-alanine carboxypeptidase/D-alanyl-D-alanine-endopeptidase [Glycomyces buryatensis]THV41322.1 D-alanyl-D-alanine carboxypeptidase/D-alanyl-D-alanine-endopeptidase [Glycomyces buryatensis]